MALRHAWILIGFMLVAGVRTAEAQCSYSVSPTTVSAPSFATNSSLSVITGSSCTYTATSSVSWLTITSVTGQGLGQVNYSVVENTTGASRVGTISVAGLTVTVTQAASSCTFTVLPTSVSAPAIGTNSSISVTTGSSCSWTSSTTASWITITSGSGTGIKAVNFTVAANATGAPRTGTMTVAGQMVTVTQAGSGCGATVTPTTVAAALVANAYTVSVTSGASCSWTASSATSWIIITAGASGSGIGGVSFNVLAATAPRTGTLTIAGQTVTVNQGGGAPPPAAPTDLRIIVR